MLVKSNAYRYTKGFWTGNSTTEPGYTWYLELVDKAVQRALAANEGATRVDFVAHSAGGGAVHVESS